MTRRFALADLPEVIPVFPLPGALLLPRARLPLNIFEPRYLAMLDDVLRSDHRLIGMVQPFESLAPQPKLHVIGCAGRVTSLSETEDGRYLIALTGVSRFRIGGEIDGFTPNQRFFLSWAQAWRRNYRDEAMKLQVNTNPHSPSKFRANGPMTNMPEFAAAWRCVEGDAMVQAADLRADIW